MTVSGCGSIFRNAKVTDENGAFAYEMKFPRDVRSEGLTIAANTGPAETKTFISATASRS